MKEKKPPSKPTPSKPEDSHLWEQATHNVTRLSKNNKVSPDIKRTRRQKLPISNPSGQITLETLMLAETFYPHPSSFQLDGALRKKFERGDLEIDGKIDLHGFTLSQAHDKFMTFMTREIKNKSRVLLIVTGKGTGSGTGVIRQNLPLWCEDNMLKQHILKITPAQPKHGGNGAYYLLLRKPR